MGKNNSLELKIRPPFVFLAFAGLMWLLAVIFPWSAFVLPAKNFIALAVAASACLFAGSSILSFLRAGTTVHPERPDRTTKLMVIGVYAITRNPMYLSLLFILTGWAVYLANIAAVVPVPLFVAYLNRFQIIPEECALASLFGREFEAYSKRVRRWL
jgi:protein-S-isoprenylcysteine O-methyltransferase Ste14